MPADWLKRQLKAQVSFILKQLGYSIRPGEIDVVRSGHYLRAVFIWRVGQPGTWLSPVSRTDPFRVSLTVRHWLQGQRN